MKSAVIELDEEVLLQSLTGPRRVCDQLSLVFEMYSAMLPMIPQWYKERRDSKTTGG